MVVVRLVLVVKDGRSSGGDCGGDGGSGGGFSGEDGCCDDYRGGSNAGRSSVDGSDGNGCGGVGDGSGGGIRFIIIKSSQTVSWWKR